MSDLMKLTVDSSDVKEAAGDVKNLGKQVSATGAQAKKGTGGLDSFGKAGLVGGKKMNTFNMRVQQGGYQLQDLIVQLQGGTSFFTAFGQQGSQFAGIFGPSGAVVGAIIALGSAVGGMAFKMATGSKDVETLEESLKSLEAAVNDYASASKAALDATKAANDEFGFTSDTLEGIIETLAIIAETKAFDQVGASIGKLREEHLHGFEHDLKNVADLLGLEGQFAMVGSEATGFNALLKTMENDSRSIGERIQAGLSLKGVLLQYGGSYGEMTDLQRAFFDDLIVSIKEMETLRGLQGGDREAATKAEADRKAAAKAEEERLKKLDALNAGRWAAFKAQHKESFAWIAEKKKAEEEAEAEKAKGVANNWKTFVKQHADSLTFTATYKKEQKALQAEIAAGYKEAGGLAQTLTNESNAYVQSVADGFVVTNDLREELGDAAYEALRLAGVDMASGISDASKEAAILASKLNISLVAAMSLKNLQDSYEESGGRGPGTEYFGQKSYNSTVQEMIDGFNRGQEKSAGTPKKDALEILMKSLTLEKELLTVETNRAAVLRSLGDDREKYSAKEINRAVVLKAAIEEQIAAQKKQQALSDLVGNSFETAMMSMIDGTKSVKDAFKSMASEIIKELYRIYVVKKIVGMVTGTWDALGSVGAPSMGGGAANGGPVSGGRSYLVGERGPEMFTPSMGGGHITPASQTNAGGVTIVQNINVSTGVQQTVRAEIRQMMPQIAQSAKGAVLDAKRRGGSYGSAFA